MFIALLAATFVISFVVTELVRRSAHKLSLIDIPIDRSMHSDPTPRGGGVGIMTAVLLVSGAWILINSKATDFLIVLVPATVAGFLGLWDDRKSLSAWFRLIVQLILAGGLLVALNYRFPPWTQQVVFGIYIPLWLSFPVIALVIVWMTNLYNFMDGADGLAGLHTVTAFFSLAVLSLVFGDEEVAFFSAVTSVSASGFLLRNWHPAKIFMGDVGAIFLGFLAGACTIWAGLRGEVSFFAALCLHGVFVIDATATLISRVSQGKQPMTPHKAHCFQRWILSGKSHKFIATAYSGVTLVWLLPAAFIIQNFSGSPTAQILVFTLGWLPLVVFAIRMKAGVDFVAQNPVSSN